MFTKIDIGFFSIVIGSFGIVSIILLDILILCSKIKLELKTCPLIMRIIHFIFPPIMWGNMIYLLLVRYHPAIRIIVAIIYCVLIFFSLIAMSDFFFCLRLHNASEHASIDFIHNLFGFLSWFSMPVCGFIQNVIRRIRQSYKDN